MLFKPGNEFTDDVTEDDNSSELSSAVSGEANAASGAPPVCDPMTMIQYAVSMDVSESVLVERLCSLPSSDVIVGHNDEDGFKRRFARWQELNQPSLTDKWQSPFAYLQQHIETLQLSEEKIADTSLGLKLITAYVERNGRPNNFHPTEEELEAARLEQEERATQLAEEEDKERRRLAQLELQQKQQREMWTAQRQTALLAEQQELLEESSKPLRQYLLDNVVPHVINGLMEVCKVQPDDPIDYLAEFLFKLNPRT